MIQIAQVIISLSLVGVIIYLIWLGLLIVFGQSRYAQVVTEFDSKYQLWILVPALNEAPVILATIQRFLVETKTLPMIKMLIIDDGSSDQTFSIVNDFIRDNRTGKVFCTHREFPNAQTGKGDALNWGYQVLLNQYATDQQHLIVGVLDADAYLTQAGYQRVLNQFTENPQLGLLQSAVKIVNPDNWLQRLQDIEFLVVNNWIQNLRNRLGNAAASGNGQFVRAALVTGHHPWGNALLEDFEFSTRFLLQNIDTKYDGDIWVYQEAIAKVRPFIRQRTRWAQGGLDCLAGYWPAIIKSKCLTKRAKSEMTFYMLLPFITVITGLANILVFGYVLVNLKIMWPVLVILIVINVLINGYLAFAYLQRLPEQQPSRIISNLINLSFYNYLLYPVTVLAFYKKLRGQSRWEKTDHGN